MPSRVTCPHCRRDLRLPDHLYDHPAQCPLCRGAFTIRWKFNPQPVELQPAEEALPDDETRPCPSCGQSIHREAVKCRHCREWVEKK